MGAGVDPGVRHARREGGQRGAEAGRTSPAPRAKATAEAEWPDGMEELVGCGMDEPEDRKVLRQRACPRQQCLEHHVGDRGSHGLGQQPVQGGPARPAGERGP